jgi:hypothetical protein
MLSRAAPWLLQKSGAAAMRSSSASVLRRASTSKIASHFHQPSAQLDEPRLYFFDLNHEVTSVPWVLLDTYCQKTRFSAKTKIHLP